MKTLPIYSLNALHVAHFINSKLFIMKRRTYALLHEAIADIAFAAGHAKYYSGDSRADMQSFISWAKEFEKLHLRTNWDIFDYIETIDEFVNEKMKEHVNKMSNQVLVPPNTDFSLIILNLIAYQTTFKPSQNGYHSIQKQISLLELLNAQLNG